MITYSADQNLIIANRFRIGANYGNQWARQPIYLILCRCGHPLKAYFNGAAPSKMMQEYGIGESKMFTYWITRYANIGWGFRVADGRPCPSCGHAVYFGGAPREAIWKYLQIEYGYSDEEQGRMFDAVEEFRKQIISNPAIGQQFGLMRETTSSRTDTMLTVAPGARIQIDERIKR